MNSADAMSHGQLYTINADGSGFKEINFDRIPNAIIWSAEEKTLFFVANSNGGVPVFKLDLANSKVDRLTDFESGIGTLELIKCHQSHFFKKRHPQPE
jgi:Tol biopolymer transport system component